MPQCKAQPFIVDLNHSTHHTPTFFCRCWQGIKSISTHNLHFPQSHLQTLITVWIFFSPSLSFSLFWPLFPKWGRVLPGAMFAQLSLSCFIQVTGITLVTSTVILRCPTTERNSLSSSGFHQSHTRCPEAVFVAPEPWTQYYFVWWEPMFPLKKQVSLDQM